ncbi:hypothetical protein ACFQ10_46055 [Streptomyces indonesiensis]
MYPPESRFAQIDNIDLTDLSFWAQPYGDRDAAFAALRGRPEPVLFREPVMPGFGQGSGYYAMVRHADIAEVSGVRRTSAPSPPRSASSICRRSSTTSSDR